MKKREKEVFIDKELTTYREDSIILSKDLYLQIDDSYSKNTFILGCPGSGKTRHIIEPNILQANTSFVINDEVGNLIDKYGNYLMHKGYKIKYISISSTAHRENILYSMRYNPFNYIYDINDIFDIVNCLICNTDGISKEYKENEANFLKIEKTLLVACFAYLYETRPKEEQVLKNIQKIIELCDFEFENPLQRIDEIFDKLNIESFAYQQYNFFKNFCDGDLIIHVLMSISIRLNFLNYDTITALTSNDDLELEKLWQEKTALFIIPSALDNACKCISAMLISQIIRVSEKVIQSKKSLIHTQLMLDMFCDIGKIPDLDKKLSDIKQRNMSTTIVFNSMSSFENMYPEYIKYMYDWEFLIKNFDVFIFTGISNQKDYQYIYNFFAGRTIEIYNKTIDKYKPLEIFKKDFCIVNLFVNKSFFGFKKKKIIEVDLIEKWGIEWLSKWYMGTFLVFIKDNTSFLTNFYNLTEHPNYKYSGEVTKENYQIENIIDVRKK